MSVTPSSPPSSSWVETGEFEANGVRLEHACLGPGPDAAPTLVLLHEGLGCTALWRDFPRALVDATGRGVLAYSRAGYGRSAPAILPRPLDYMTREALDVLPAVLDAFGVRRAVLLGHSDGATIAAIHAGRVADDRVRGLVLMAPHFFTEPAGLAEIRAARVAFERDDGLRTRMAKYHDDPDNAFRGWNDAWLHPDFETWNVSDVIDGIRVPTLAIQGARDQYGTMAQIDVMRRRARAPLETLILDGCRHSPHLERPDEVIAAVADHADAVPSAP